MAVATYELIGSAIASGGETSLSFLSIPQNFSDLKLVGSHRFSSGGQIGTSVKIAINGVTTNQTSRMLNGNGASAASYTDTKIFASGNGSSSTNNTFGNNEFYFSNYTTSNNKSISINGISENNATTSYQEITAALWSSSAAITSITLTEYNGIYTFAAYSSFYLYGIKNS
jgi:hypothetical protein